VDPQIKWQVKGSEFFSKGKTTPFEDRVFSGKVIKTMLRGKFIYDSETGINVDPGYGKFIKPQKGGE